MLLWAFLWGAWGLSAQTPRALNMTLLGQWSDNSIPPTSSLNLRYSGCWGLTVNGRDIAVVGASNAILFFDVTNDAKPTLLAQFPSAFTTVWREFRAYKQRVYAVSDNTSEGLRIFDLSALPRGEIRESGKTIRYFQSAHTITIDTLHARIYLNGTNTANKGLVVLSVADSVDAPHLLAKVDSLPGRYIHDSYVRNHIVYASSGFSGLFVYDFTQPSAPRVLGSVSTGGYNHNSWLTRDGRYAYYTEEIPAARPIRVLNLQRLAVGELEVVRPFLDTLTRGTSGGPIPHNVIVRDNLLYNSQYEDGLLLYNIDNPTQPKLVAYYDTHPQNTQYNGYYGNWGCYPYANGKVVAVDMQNGVFLLRLARDLVPTQEIVRPQHPVRVWPNPAVAEVRIAIAGAGEAATAPWRVQLLTAWGQLVIEKTALAGADQVVLDVQHLARGAYFVKVLGGEKKSYAVEKIILR